MVSGKWSGMHQKTSRTRCKIRKVDTWSAGCGLTAIPSDHVHAV
jgi:hypothetical protein